MKTVTIIYTDNSKGMFDCKSTRYDNKAAVFCTTDDEMIIIPYYNVYFIKECESEGKNMINETLKANRAYQRDKDDAYNRGYKQGKTDAEPHWIPVTERLPKKSGVYTVTDHKGDVVRFVFNTHSDSSCKYWYRCAKAWMPLPESYKEVTE